MSALHLRDLFHPWKIWQAGFRAGATLTLKNQGEVAHDASQQPASVQHTVVHAYNPTRIKAMAREMRTPRITLPPFHAYMHTHAVPLARHAQVPAPEQPIPEDAPDDLGLNDCPPAPALPEPVLLPEWVTADMPDVSQQLTLHGNEDRATLLGVQPKDCEPELSEKDEDATEHVAAIIKLRHCEHEQKGA